MGSVGGRALLGGLLLVQHLAALLLLLLPITSSGISEHFLRYFPQQQVSYVELWNCSFPVFLLICCTQSSFLTISSLCPTPQNGAWSHSFLISLL